MKRKRKKVLLQTICSRCMVFTQSNLLLWSGFDPVGTLRFSAVAKSPVWPSSSGGATVPTMFMLESKGSSFDDAGDDDEETDKLLPAAWVIRGANRRKSRQRRRRRRGGGQRRKRLLISAENVFDSNRRSLSSWFWGICDYIGKTSFGPCHWLTYVPRKLPSYFGNFWSIYLFIHLYNDKNTNTIFDRWTAPMKYPTDLKNQVRQEPNVRFKILISS